MAQQLKWQLGTVVEIRQETPNVRSLILDVPDWTTHLAGQHVDVRLTAEDGYQAQRSYSILRSEVASLGIHYAVVSDNDYKTWDAYNVAAWPTVFLLDKQGRIRCTSVKGL